MELEEKVKQSRRVTLVHSDVLLRLTDKNPRITGRSQLVHSLITAYGLTDHLTIVHPRPASQAELQAFHSSDYVSCLATTDGEEEEVSGMDDTLEAYGLCYDCPPFPGVYDYMCAIAGASLSAAESIMVGDADVAINWYGGWHHARKDEASGFCYVNDIVLAILKLLERFQRVLYIDIDIHHGDGVEDAFYHSNRVVTLSLHKHSPGFFPGSGALDSVGTGRGKYHCINVPLSDGIRDDQYHTIFTRIASELRQGFKPDVVVMQCGADLLSGDPIGSFSLTPHGVGRCVTDVLQWGLPTLLLGGGGYNFPNTARLWALCTALAVGMALKTEIPEHEYFVQYSPDYQLTVAPGNRPNENASKSVQDMLQTISGYLSNVTNS